MPSLTARRDWGALRRALAIVAALLVGAAASPQARADAPSPWVEFASDGSLSVRALVGPGVACPTVTAGSQPVAMRARAGSDGAFPFSACEARVPPGATAVSVGKAAVPTLAAEVKRVVVIGDSGCRVDRGAAQDCNQPGAWPFRQIAERAAARRPDLVIHVGDYYYRETACPGSRAGCAGSPHGDNWAAWQADFFDPAARLLAAAPWVMVRGNHELCRRGGQGWVRLIDPLPFAPCSDRSEPYALAAGGLSLLVFDSAGADDFTALPERVAPYRQQLGRLLQDAPAHSWMVTHRPVWAPAGAQLSALALNLTEQEAIRGQIPAGLDLVLSGHLHDFEAFGFGPQRPPQLVVGTAGDTLLDLGTDPAPGREIDGMPLTKALALERFGYLVLDRAGEGWDGVFYGPDDAVLARCTLRNRDLDCRE